MPLYTFYCSDFSGNQKFAQALANLHAKTFHTDPSLVRVEFVLKLSAQARWGFGGVGFKPSTSIFKPPQTTDYVVAQIPFTGSADEWKEYCGKLVRIWGSKLRTIYLRRVDMEFEVEEEGVEGKIVGSETNVAYESTSQAEEVEAPPSYKKS